MRRPWLIGCAIVCLLAAAVVVIAASALFYVKMGTGDPTRTVRQSPAAVDLADPDQLAPIRVGERVEALSTDGWQWAIVVALPDHDTAEIDYESDQLPNERLDVRLVRRAAQPMTPESARIATPKPSGSKRGVLPSAGEASNRTGVPPPIKREPEAARDVLISGVENAYVGCFNDTSALELNGFLERSATNTPQTCIQKCRELGYAFAGLQYGESCLCGNEYGKYGESDHCDYPCTGDPAQTCGGYSTNAIYRTEGTLSIEERGP
ncbi:hypothetical protein C7S18_10415 [Ahniella affigens]|uniref:WSC domain-containing protein n=1 Tax=Ahniella affigens TaxID=2021234 RepID=A0A2P1PRX4_9GAMM|nr:WSC domain-containing protein [Ahniella affigens]AVP97584.1 hypothetical protein C7S18_10415 [Ahniella affigens]